MQLDYVDIFYHHRMDPETPLEETILALDQIVRSGKALYAGISNYDGEHAKKALEIAKEIHLSPLLVQKPNGLTDYLWPFLCVRTKTHEWKAKLNV